jgi:hypothetical protein
VSAPSPFVSVGAVVTGIHLGHVCSCPELLRVGAGAPGGLGCRASAAGLLPSSPPCPGAGDSLHAVGREAALYFDRCVLFGGRLTDIYICNVCSSHEILRRNCRGQLFRPDAHGGQQQQAGANHVDRQPGGGLGASPSIFLDKNRRDLGESQPNFPPTPWPLYCRAQLIGVWVTAGVVTSHTCFRWSLTHPNVHAQFNDSHNFGGASSMLSQSNGRALLIEGDAGSLEISGLAMNNERDAATNLWAAGASSRSTVRTRFCVWGWGGIMGSRKYRNVGESQPR